jgi:hypothetical protein
MGGKPSRPILSAGSQPAGSRGPGTPSTGSSAAAAAFAASAPAAKVFVPLSSTSPVMPFPASTPAWAGPDPFLQRSSIAVQLIMQHLDARSRLFFARCSRSLQHDAQPPFAWEHCIINVPAMRVLQDPHFLEHLRASRFRSLPTRLCWNAFAESADASPLQPPPAEATGLAPVPPSTVVMLNVAALLERPVAIEVAGPTIHWPTLLSQPNMQSITALSIKQFDVLKLQMLEVLRSLPRLHELELRLMNPGQVHNASAHLPLLMQLPALDDLSCDFALWLRIAPMRPARQLKRLAIHFVPGPQSNVTRMALCVPQLLDVEVLAMYGPPIRQSSVVDNAFDTDCAAALSYLKSLREFHIRVRHSTTLIPLMQLYLVSTLKKLQLDCVDHVPNPSLLHMLVSHRPSLIFVVRILFIDEPRPPHIDPALFRSLTQGPLARRVRIEGLGAGPGRTHDKDAF